MKRLFLFGLFIIPTLHSIQAQQLPITLNNTHYEAYITTIDSTEKSQLLNHAHYLSSDALQGRKSGTEENKVARNYILSELKKTSLPTEKQAFSFTRYGKTIEAENIIATLKGTTYPDSYIAITAHYDHEGVNPNSDGDNIYNGADDNASGTAALLMLAKYFSLHPTNHSLLFIALDAEEMGLQGAKYFVENSGDKKIVLNVNMDMIGRSEDSTINICGTFYTPSLNQFFTAAQKLNLPLNITLGHDGLDNKQSWVYSSDHYHFFRYNIPFLYFGVEDHDDYHTPKDEYNRLTHDFYGNAFQFIKESIKQLDKKMSY